MRYRPLHQAATGEVARMLSILSDTDCLEVLRRLRHQPCTENTLVLLTGKGAPNIKRILAQLQRTKLLDAQHHLGQTSYSLKNERAAAFVDILDGMAQDAGKQINGLIQAVLFRDPSLRRIGNDELAQGLRKGLLTLVDIRPKAEFDSGHLEGAISVPLSQDLRDEVVSAVCEEGVIFCRGGFCLWVDIEGERLRRRGHVETCRALSIYSLENLVPGRLISA